MVQDRDYNLTLPGSASSASPSSQSEESHAPALPKANAMNLQTSRSARKSISEASHRSFPSGQIPDDSQSLIEATYFKYHVELSKLAHEAVSQLYSPAIRQYRWSKIQALIDDYDDHLTTWKTNLEHPFGGLAYDFALDLYQSPLSVALAIQFNCIRAIVNRPCLYRRERTTFKQSSHTAVSRCVGSARAVIDLVVTSPAVALICQGPKWWLLLHHTKRALTVVLLELAFRAEHMPSEAEELLAEAKKALAWLRGMARTSKIAEHTLITMSGLLVKAARRVGIDAGNDVFSDILIEQPEGWSHYSNEDTPGSHETPILATDPHQSQAPTSMHFGMPADSAAFGNFWSHNMNQFKPYQDQVTHQNFVELEAFDQFSFEPMTTGQGDVQGSYAPYQPSGVGGEMPHLDSSSAMPHSHYSSSMPQQQHQHQGSGVRADEYLMDDCFGFDLRRNS